ncbi:peptidase [Desulfonatronovibrio magnus]|uniref:peptidase n=1 Tax=Desulfonatronovibrio magnus TaxID=698827 RepID=UPI0005EBF34D|nr:peptidase [Desulfonatronovibrio magnus]
MTFCLGITVSDGLVGIADTRIMSGNELTTAPKVSCYSFENGYGAFFMMTSGLRSVRDKVMTYLDEAISMADEPYDRMYKAANAVSEQIRKVAGEDREYLERSGLNFNIHVLIGGQLKNDAEHQLYLIYPEGNWVIITHGTPFHIIGESGYGKPVLDRTLKFTDNIGFALKVGCLAFDSTRISASDVDFPVDVVLYYKDSNQLVEHRFEKSDLAEISTWWQEKLRSLVHELPSEWIDNIAAKLTKVQKSQILQAKNQGRVI